ncbi:MAG: GTPase Era [Candidatus Riflebacteria bacterium]|nr:GTPase Era [Candidatus Riflebacteria bacterium]
MKSSAIETRFGAIGVFGRANAGKSTLVNTLVGEHVSIVSAKPQTTRRRILGILTRGSDQIVFCDTPGMHPIRNKLDAFMATEISETLRGLQAAMFLVDASDPRPEEDAVYLSNVVKLLDGPLMLVFTKMDILEKRVCKADATAKIRELEEQYRSKTKFSGVFAVSSTRNAGLADLLEKLKTLLVPGAHAYSADDYTTQSEREIVEEVIREEILKKYRDEVPHSVAVIVQDFQERENGKTVVTVDLILEKSSHKKIIIGSGGEGIKALGISAREHLNQLLGRDLYLELWVRIRANWRKDDVWVRRMGYHR